MIDRDELANLMGVDPKSLSMHSDHVVCVLRSSREAVIIGNFRDELIARPGGIDKNLSSVLIGAEMIADGAPIDDVCFSTIPRESAIEYMVIQGYPRDQWPTKELADRLSQL